MPLNQVILNKDSPVFIIGPGAIGTLLWKKFSTQSHVTLIGRSQKKSNKKIKTWSEVASFPKNSIIFITTKTPDLSEVIPLLKYRGHYSNQFVFCQNGLGIFNNTKKINADFFKQYKDQIFRASFWVGARLRNNKLLLAGRPQVELTKNTPPTIQSLFKDSGFIVKNCANALTLEWKKAIINITINGLCTLVNAPNKAIIDQKHLYCIAKKLSYEALQVAQKEGALINERHCKEVFNIARKTGSNLNSMLLDFQKNHYPSELPWLNIELVKRAKKLGLKTPINEALCTLLSACSSY